MSLVLHFDDEAVLAAALARSLAWECAPLQCHHFPDGEVKLTLPGRLPERVVLVRGLQQPNTKLATLLIAAPAARELGARHLCLVAPYLAYMRQDMQFHPGEAVSQRHVGQALAQWFDAVITVDPHLHRVASMDEVVPGRRGLAVSASPLLGGLAAHQVPGALLLAPDEEAGQWVRAAAHAHGLDFAVCHKQRHGDREVEVALHGADVRGRAVVVLDDVASTGRTLVAAAQAALASGAISVDVAVTHGLFIGDALAQVRAAGVRHVWSSDCVPHVTNAVSVVGLLAAAVQHLQ
jgi:ribose-phosphate pyrophosphokinase